MTDPLSTLIVTFGKHRGHSISALMNDMPYCEWLMKQGWWKDKWEAKVLTAVTRGLPLPPAPKVRPILEQEYDLAEERPAKVRKITHRQYENSTFQFVCPGCGDNKCTRLGSKDNTIFPGVLVRCDSCGEHASFTIYWSSDAAREYGHGEQLCAKIESIKCNRAATSDVEYERACEKCPDRKGIYADHTTCGCWRQFECKCIIEAERRSQFLP